MASIDALRFLIVTGKGGVGKTTVAAAQATALAARGKRVLVCLCNTKERLSSMLGCSAIGSEITRAGHNIWAINMDPEVAMEEYGMMTFKSRALYTMLFDNDYVRSFLRAIPGMHEWAMLGKAWWHTTEQNADGTPKYDVVILDAPATGHGLDMLRVPKILVELVPSGMLRRDAEIAWNLFQNPKLTGAVVVTLPEEMPTSETIELATALRTELNIPIARVVINGVLSQLFTPSEQHALIAHNQATANAPTPAANERRTAATLLLRTGAFRAMREGVQLQSIARLAEAVSKTATQLPLLLEDAATPTAIRELSAYL
jgi:anion-transporting  ArsA/GET3 family ATPase